MQDVNEEAVKHTISLPHSVGIVVGDLYVGSE